MDLWWTVRGASDHNSLHYGCVRCWRNSVPAFSGLLAVTGWEYEFLRSSELGIHLLSLRVLKHSHGVQTQVWPHICHSCFLGQLFDLEHWRCYLNSEVGRALCLQSLDAVSWSSSYPSSILGSVLMVFVTHFTRREETGKWTLSNSPAPFASRYFAGSDSEAEQCALH